MKYFTKSMWRGLQQIGPEAEENHLQWQRAFETYRASLEGLRSRVGLEAFNFFADADVHDAELLDVRIIDGKPTSSARRTCPTLAEPHGIPGTSRTDDFGRER